MKEHVSHYFVVLTVASVEISIYIIMYIKSVLFVRGVYIL